MRTTMCGKLSLVVVAVCALAGCNREPPVAQSSQPKEKATATTPAGQGQLPPDHPPIPQGGQMPPQGQVPAGEPHQHEEAAALAWTLPEGWREDETPRPMREATLLVGTGEQAAELVVTRLGGQFGEFGANINRWRGQVGLEPAADANTTASRDVKSPAGDIKVYEIDGPAKKMLVGILKQGEFNWFFKFVGDKATVTQNAAKFDQFLQSVRTP